MNFFFKIVCDENQDRCQKIFCECDKEVVIAIAETVAVTECPLNNPGCPEI